MFLNIFLAGGLTAVAAPILVHIAHRRKIVPVEWGAMRFLLEMMRRSRSRLFIEQWLLLLIRCALVLCLSLALMRPAVSPRPIAAGGAGVVRHGRVAAVILFDDSASTAAGRGSSSLERMKELALAYIDSLERGDEVSLIRLSQLNEALADPLLDLEAAREWVAAIEPSGASSDVPGLLEEGLIQLTRHFNPAAELVLVTDGGAEGWGWHDRARWAELQGRLSPVAGEGGGEPRARPRLVVLRAARPQDMGNLAVLDLRVERSLVPAGREVSIRARIEHTGAHVARGMRMLLKVDGRTVEERGLEIEPGGTRDAAFSHTFRAGGSHSVEVQVNGANDALPGDDRRGLSVDVLERVPVLLVQEGEARDLEGSLGLLHLALDPQGDGSMLFAAKRIQVGQLGRERLLDYRAVVLGDVTALDAAAVTELERYVVGGGGLLVGMGPRVDVDHVNRFWARDGDGFLPCPLGELRAPERAAVPAGCRRGHPAFSAFSGPSGEAWKAGAVRKFYATDRRGVDVAELDVLLSLDSGEPLIVERSRGHGRVVLVTSSLDLSWSDLPSEAAYVPLMRGLVAHLASQVQPPRNLLLGSRISHVGAGGTPVLKAPDGRSSEMEPGAWEGRQAFVSSRLQKAGIYSVASPGRKDVVCYALDIDPAESRLEEFAAEEQAAALARMRPVILGSRAEIAKVLDPSHRRPAELWRIFLASAIVLLFLESAVTRAQAVRRSAGAQGASMRDVVSAAGGKRS